ncbi:DUF6538 domain-containing protein [Leisingera sp. S232]|uniref:DUF6538 domain-containing protein n=1 Tax=Leisingera sp. S232 TaxID=3415132 RepID=UPI003C7A6E80
MLNWHPATVSRRGQKYYVVLTVPEDAREAVGQRQLRRSAGTTDLREAEKKRCDLELVMRQQVLRKVQEAKLTSPDSAFQTAVKELGLSDLGYLFPYSPEVGDVIPQTMQEAPPQDAYTARRAIQELEKAETEIRLTSLSQDDTERQLQMLQRFDLNPPTPERAAELVSNAKHELEQSFGDGKPDVTLRSYLPDFEASLDRRVSNGNLQEKTQKSRLKNIEQFIAVVGEALLHKGRRGFTLRIP